jgi:hypothetical protein
MPTPANWPFRSSLKTMLSLGVKYCEKRSFSDWTMPFSEAVSSELRGTFL